MVPGSHVHTGRSGVGGWGGDESVRWHSFQGHMYTQVGVGWVGGVGDESVRWHSFQGHMYTQVGVGWVGGVGDESVRWHSFQGHMYTQAGVGRGQVSTYRAKNNKCRSFPPALPLHT